MQLQWSHCVLKVRDLDAMISFYCDTLGFRVADSGTINLGTETALAFLSGSSSDHHQLALTEGRGPEDATSLEHNAFRAESIADVRTMLDRVTADDRVSFVMPLTHGNAVSVYFADPEGNGVEVFCDTAWHVPQPQAEPWDPALSDDEVLASVEANFSGRPGVMPMEQYRAQQAAVFGESSV